MSDPSRERQPDPAPPVPPVSSLGRPIDELIRAGVLGQPETPGHLASLDRLAIIRPIGRGATSDVLLARTAETGDLCAIKLLRPEFCAHPAFVTRFLAAGRAQQRLEHPNIVRVLTVSERAPGPYIVMPHFPRGSLAGMLHRGQPLESALALDVASQIAEALRYAHDQGTIHCDLKPENILLGEDGRVCLTDFGMARTVFNDPVLDAAAGPREGTAPYMSPAVVAGIKEDTRCDVYSYGALLYHLLTGRPPYDAPRDQDILAQIRSGPPRPILELNPKASPGLAAVCQGAMQQEQRDRYANMADVLADLALVRAGRPPLGPRGRSAASSLGARLLGHKRSLLAAGVAATLLLAAWWFWPRAPRLLALHQFALAGSSSGQVEVGNWNSDGVPDLCTLENGVLRVEALTRTVRPAAAWWQAPRQPRLYALTNEPVLNFPLLVPHSLYLSFVGLANVTGGPAEEALVVGDDRTEVILNAIGQRGGSTREFRLGGSFYPDKHTTQACRTGIEGVPRLFEPPGAGRRQLLVPISTGWALRPRGLLSFPAEGGPALWTNLIAGTPRGIEFCNLGDSNDPCIALGSYAVSNGHKLADGTADSTCYLHIFDPRGQLKWRRAVGDEFTACEPLAVHAPTNRPGSVYAWLSAAPEVRRKEGKAAIGRVLRFDAQGREFPAFDAGAGLWSCLAGDLAGKGEDEIFATDIAGFLHVLRPDLSVRLKVPVTATPPLSPAATPRKSVPESSTRPATSADDPDYVALRLVGLGRFPRAKNPCLVLSSWIRQVVTNAAPDDRREDTTVIHANQLEIVILDAEFRTVLRHPVAPVSVHPPSPTWLRLADFNGDGYTEILALTAEATVYAVQ
jgi:hypothetical protein